MGHVSSGPSAKALFTCMMWTWLQPQFAWPSRLRCCQLQQAKASDLHVVTEIADAVMKSCGTMLSMRSLNMMDSTGIKES
ncbi:Sophorolipid acetyltransferase [Fusarium oxysporum f. sp. albedinis]|nr:Sophorolipid acetyltransferase [Fusarium oxysporum f. sp. albedinis]